MLCQTSHALSESSVPAATAVTDVAAERETPQVALGATGGVVGTHSVFSMSPTDPSGVDERARVLVRVEEGDWTLVSGLQHQRPRDKV